MLIFFSDAIESIKNAGVNWQYLQGYKSKFAIIKLWVTISLKIINDMDW
jgi:hypothetical protein